MFSFYKSSPEDETRWWMAFNISYALFNETISHTLDSDETVFRSLHIFLSCVAKYDTVKEHVNKDTQHATNHLDCLERVGRDFHSWLEKKTRWARMHDSLKVRFIIMHAFHASVCLNPDLPNDTCKGIRKHINIAMHR